MGVLSVRHERGAEVGEERGDEAFLGRGAGASWSRRERPHRKEIVPHCDGGQTLPLRASFPPFSDGADEIPSSSILP